MNRFLLTLTISMLLTFGFVFPPDSCCHGISEMFDMSNQARLIPDIEDGYGVAFRDMNGDALPDIYLVCFRNLNRLLVNQGAGRPFQDATVVSGLGGNLMPQGTHNLELGVMAADVTNNGRPDLIIVGWGVATSLYHNAGSLPFKFISDFQHLAPLDANGCAAADMNGDGWLDLFITDEHHSNRLLVNDKHKGFQEKTRRYGADYNGISQGASFCDVDGDMDPDLYVTNWFGPDLFYENIESRFVRRQVDIPPCQQNISTNGVTFGDIDNDGDFDFIVTNREGRNFVIENTSGPSDTAWAFRDISASSGMNEASVSYGSVLADFNHDGWLDCYVTNIGVNQCYLNTGDGRFKKVHEQPKTRNSGYSTGAACADFDGDGDLDLFVANKDTFSVLYTNPADNNQFIQLKLKGVRSNRDAVGSKVLLYQPDADFHSDALLATREISGGSGYFSMNDPTVHFGLDTLKFVDVLIRFPSGREIELTHLSAGHVYEVWEYGLIVKRVIDVSRLSSSKIREPLFWQVSGLIAGYFFFLVLFVLWGRKRYHWSNATLNGMLAAFFAVAVFCLLFLKYLGTFHLIGVVYSINLLLIVVFIVISERVRHIRESQEVYHAMLTALNQEIIKIHDDEKLVKTVVETVTAQPFFKDCCIALFDESAQSVSQLTCLGLVCSRHQVEALDMNQYHDLMTAEPYLTQKTTPGAGPVFKCLHADFIIPIHRDGHLYGFIALGGKDGSAIALRETMDLFGSLANQMAFALQNNAYLKQSTEMIKQLTEAEIREIYLEQLEVTNESLEEKNRELQTLYRELQTTQSHLVQKEKMASLGQLVAGISHELNNPVGFVYANMKQLPRYLEIIEASVRGETTETMDSWLPDLRQLIDDSIQGAQMVKELSLNLKKFSHIDQAQWKESDIHEGIRSCLAILNPLLKNRIKVVTDFQATGLIECNLGQLNQVFMNLLNNAAQAIEGEGVITIHTEDVDEQIDILIRDTGQGIHESVQSKIFDPFFTTKDVGEGSGLGLSISYGIVQQHGGRLTFESSETGTEFAIRLPHRRSVH